MGSGNSDLDGGDPVLGLVAHLPQPIRFVGVGAMGFITDLGMFSLLIVPFGRPLLVRLMSMAIATLVTWRLNRALTFDSSGRRQSEEALRYAAVTLVAQGLNYAIFAVLVITMFGFLPQAALVCGSLIAAVFTYFGHRLFAFAPVAVPSVVSSPLHPQDPA
jgi:putative flippase GtrA